MDFLFINTNELAALMELPLIQRVAYLMGIRPYMDKQTCIVGIKRKISYQSLREILYVAPIAGVKTESPSHQQVRRVVKSLERAGLITIQSTEKQLILKCVLAAEDRSAQNKAGMRPTLQGDSSQLSNSCIKTISYKDTLKQTDRVKTTQADTPHNSEDNYIFLRQQFEKFWTAYPQPQNKQKAWEAFKNLNPDHVLFEEILKALQAQITHYHQQQQLGSWLPNWKYPENWIKQQSWNDELMTYTTLETPHANNQRHTAKKSAFDIFWESCKDGASYEFSDEASQSSTSGNNVIAFKRSR